MGLGDCILHINYIHEISKKYGKPVSILVKENTKAKDLFEDDPYIDKVITLDRLTDNSGSHDGLNGFFKLAKDIKENKSIVVSAVNFQKMVDNDTEFDFTSFVKSVSRKNTAVPKYIRDNWTIVLSIRNQLENSK